MTMTLPFASARSLALVCLFVFTAASRAQHDPLSASILRRGDASWELARKIWGWAEPGYQETRSAKLIAAAHAEQRRRLTGRTYQPLILPGQSPPLDYRDPPRRKAMAETP